MYERELPDEEMVVGEDIPRAAVSALREYLLKDVRRKPVILPTFLFSGTNLENLHIMLPCTREEPRREIMLEKNKDEKYSIKGKVTNYVSSTTLLDRDSLSGQVFLGQLPNGVPYPSLEATITRAYDEVKRLTVEDIRKAKQRPNQ